MTDFKFGDIVLLRFPFTDQQGSKRRPAVVISNQAYNEARPDVILMAITSQIRERTGFGELAIDGWKEAGLLKSSIIKPVIFTIEQKLIIKRLGQLKENDQTTIKAGFQEIVG